MLCGNSRLTQPRWRISKASATGPAIGSRGSAGSSVMLSLGLEDISGAAHGLQIAGIAWIELDLATQARHLHVDIADIAAERRGLRQLLARHGLSGLLRQDRQKAGLSRGQVHGIAATEQFGARQVEPERPEPDLAHGPRRLG